MSTTTRIDVAQNLFRVLETQDPLLAARVVAADNHNVTASSSPEAGALPGPAGVLASSAWLRSAFPDLAFAFTGAATNEEGVWLDLRMTATHTGPFVRFENGEAAQVIPPTGRRIQVQQVHFVAITDGLVKRHDALRDDLGMLEQLGVFPPGPQALSMLAWKVSGRAARAARDVSAAAAAAAATAV